MRTRILSLAVLGGAVATVLSAIVVAGPAQASTPSTPTYYVSLGDSYAVGYQPGHGATTGYSGFVASKTHMKLVNFGCGGATTTSLLQTVGCPDVLPHTAGGVTYPTTTQIAAADAFLAANKGHIGLITVTIGGNDVTGCATQPNIATCVATAAKTIETNVTALAANLRNAAGSGVPIIGSTYPDVILGAYVYPHHPPSAQSLALAKASVPAFKSLINPALSKSYASAKASFVDVTQATGAYKPLNKETKSKSKKGKSKSYAHLPIAVARVCRITWYCTKGDIHANSKGYNIIGHLMVKKYDALKKAKSH
jgi:lysophospholipase L1-like esterase